MQLEGSNKILELIGLKLARPRNFKYEILRSNKMNSYMRVQLVRLESKKDNPEEF